jgi:hypothetical protein
LRVAAFLVDKVLRVKIRLPLKLKLLFRVGESGATVCAIGQGIFEEFCENGFYEDGEEERMALWKFRADAKRGTVANSILGIFLHTACEKFHMRDPKRMHTVSNDIN